MIIDIVSVSLFRCAVHLRGSLALLLDFSQQRLVQLKLLAIHFLLRLLRLLLMHLLLQERSVLRIYRLDFVGNSLLFRLVVLLVPRPQQSLLIVIGLRCILSLLLLHHLPRKQIAHLLLFLSLAFHALLILFSHAEFPLHFVAIQCVVLITLSLVLLLDNVASHIVHELLCTTLTSKELTLAILLHLVEHANLLILGLHV